MTSSRTASLLILALLIGACSSTASTGEPNSSSTTTDSEDPGGAPAAGTDSVGTETMFEVGRPDLNPTGNRVVEGVGALTADPVVIPLPGTPVLVVPVTGDENLWAVELESGQQLVVDETGIVDDAVRFSPDFAPATPVDDPLPDARAVRSAAPQGTPTVEAVLVQPTDRYGHGVLGDKFEADAIAVTVDGQTTTFSPTDGSVIEGLSPILADVDGDGTVEILATVSNADAGARLAFYALDGTPIAASDPIGRGGRWRNQLGIGPVGPNGETEIVDVHTPHLGRTIEFFQLNGDRLQLVASVQGFTSHVAGSRNLDLGIIADGDGDGTLDVIAPTGDLRTIGIISRTPEGAEVAAIIELDGELTTNIGARSYNGTVDFAVGTNTGNLLLWPGQG